MSRFPRCAAILFVGIAAFGCATVPGRVIGPGSPDFNFRKPPCKAKEVPVATDQVEVRYLGAGGVAIGWKKDIILIGPFFSNYSLLRALVLRNRTNEKRIDCGLEHVTLDRVRSVLAGHSHYDHLGDVPSVMRRLPEPVAIHVNDAGVVLLQPYDLDVQSFERMEAPKEIAPNIRFRAFPSGHAPQFCLAGTRLCIRYANRDEPRPSNEFWEHRRAWELARGRTHAFLIDLMDGSEVRYRIYYNDAAMDETEVTLPDDPQVDLAILCAPGWNFVRGYPRSLLEKLRPRHVIVTHYEDFFVRWHRAWRFVPVLTGRGAAKFLEIVNHAPIEGETPMNPVCGPSNRKWTMPVPGSQVVFAVP